MTPKAASSQLFALFFALSVLFFWKPLWTLGQFSLASEQYSHILLIPIVSAMLLYQEREKIFARKQSGWRLGIAVIGFGAIPYALAVRLTGSLSENDQLSLAIFSVIVVWLGLFLAFNGQASFRAGLFPLCFLFLMVPIPEVILDAIIEVLQHRSADVTDMLFRASGIPAYREGLVFSLPGITIQVAKECSGIRSSLALFITSLLAGHLYLRSPASKMALYAAVVPITLFKNGLRILTLSALAVYVDPAILDSTAHRRGGIPFFGLALVTMGAVLWFLRKTEDGHWTKWRKSLFSGRAIESSTKQGSQR